MKAIVISRDNDISELISLELSAHFECDTKESMENCSEYDLVVCDVDTAEPPAYMNGRLVTFSRVQGNAQLLRPFLLSDLLSLCLDKKEKSISLDFGRGAAIIDGATVTLTHRELLLLDALISARGEVVSCERLLALAFDGSDDRNLLGVYIHYLRSKLERERRFIYSQRGKGYYLDLEGYTVC